MSMEFDGMAAQSGRQAEEKSYECKVEFRKRTKCVFFFFSLFFVFGLNLLPISRCLKNSF